MRFFLPKIKAFTFGWTPCSSHYWAKLCKEKSTLFPNKYQYFSGWIKNQLYFSGVYPEQWAQRRSRSTLFQKSTASPESSSPSHILPSTSCTGTFVQQRLLNGDWWSLRQWTQIGRMLSHIFKQLSFLIIRCLRVCKLVQKSNHRRKSIVNSCPQVCLPRPERTDKWDLSRRLAENKEED